MKNNTFDVIIIGGGPVGVFLAIELGLNNIKTLVLEKYATPLLSPRAQSLSSRSMEFLVRFGINDKLKAKIVLGNDVPQEGVWCSKLNGQTYGVGSMNLALNNNDLSPEKYIRIPLWLTEDVLRQKLTTLTSVTFIKETQVKDIKLVDNLVVVDAESQNQIVNYKASYAIGCDGANSITRNKLKVHCLNLAPARRVINILFETNELEQRITIERGFIYYILENRYPSVIGLVNPQSGLWYSQIVYDGEESDIDKIDLNGLIDEISGFSFNKKIIESHFWSMQPQIAERFSYQNKIFLVGDSAHAFVPTGGFGLNTGLAGALNLGWKLASVIKQVAHPSILETYELERRPIAMRNLEAAQHNAKNMVEIRKKHDPKTDPEGFAKANSEAAVTHSQSLGLAMGYAYFDSPLTKLNNNQSIVQTSQRIYTPKVEPGYFLPHTQIDGKPIYTKLSTINWTLIINSTNDMHLIQLWLDQANNAKLKVETLFVPVNTYPYRYILIRPDWHIAYTSNLLNNDYLTQNWQIK